MSKNYKNLVFAGGGILSISYLGVLDYLYSHNIIQDIDNVAGTSAGAITACLCSFSLPFDQLKSIADTLDFYKIPLKKSHSDLNIPLKLKRDIEPVLGNINNLINMIKNYGWYSTDYFNEWIRKIISSQFNTRMKGPPYTFKDFKNSYIHKNQKDFLDLYITGTNITTGQLKIFCYENTPNMEVAEAVRISMSIPFFFEPVKNGNKLFCDGGVLFNYPINIFDLDSGNANKQTLGVKFVSSRKNKKINTLAAFAENLCRTYMNVQEIQYKSQLEDVMRTIEINTQNISSTDFDIKPNDRTYKFLYNQGYLAASRYFNKLKH